MTDFNFIPTKSHQPNKFAVPRSPQAKGLPWPSWFAAPRAFTSGAPHPRFSEQSKSTATLMLKLALPALALEAPLRFALSLGGRSPFMENPNVTCIENEVDFNVLLSNCEGYLTYGSLIA